MGYSRKIDLIGELLLSTFLHHQKQTEFHALSQGISQILAAARSAKICTELSRKQKFHSN